MGLKGTKNWLPMGQFIVRRTGRGAEKQTDKRMGTPMEGWTDGWMNYRMDGPLDRRTDSGLAFFRIEMYTAAQIKGSTYFKCIFDDS